MAIDYLGVHLHQIVLLLVYDVFVVEQHAEQQVVHTAQQHLVERLLRVVLPVVAGDVHCFHFVPDISLLEREYDTQKRPTLTRVG